MFLHQNIGGRQSLPCILYAVSASTRHTSMFSPQQEQSNLLQLQDQLLGKHFDPNRQEAGASAKLVDILLAKEFSKLSVLERSKTYEELHGVGECVEETPVFIEKALQQLDEEISKIRRKSAYELAEEQNKEYVTNPTFRIMFLRASAFHPGKAAARLVGYFEGILKYFGESLLTKRIQYSDLNSDDQACAKAGHLQILPSRDRSGRVVFTDIDPFQDKSYVTANNRLKACIHMWLMLAEDDENQKRGLVVIVMQMGSLDLARASLPVSREFPRVLSWLPLRVCALHFCTDDAFLGSLFRVAVLGVPADSRGRHRCHIGTYTEIKYSLLGFGIPVDFLPFSQSGAIKKTNLNRWIAKNISRDIELAYNGAFTGVDLPTRNDVLMGKGKPYQHHAGNVLLKDLVEANIDKYQAAHQSLDKMDVVLNVISTIKARSGRFLEKDDDGLWREPHDVDVMDKVRKRFHRTIAKEQPQGNDRAHTKPADEGNAASTFLQQGKRPRFDSNCCGL